MQAFLLSSQKQQNSTENARHIQVRALLVSQIHVQFITHTQICFGTKKLKFLPMTSFHTWIKRKLCLKDMKMSLSTLFSVNKANTEKRKFSIFDLFTRGMYFFRNQSYRFNLTYLTHDFVSERIILNAQRGHFYIGFNIWKNWSVTAPPRERSARASLFWQEH